MFINDKLNGFGRWITVYWDGELTRSHFGYWKDGKPHGYGLVEYSNGDRKEGFVKDDNFKSKNDFFKEPKIKLGKYLVMNDQWPD
jgi:hypothetical protein